MKKAIIIPLLSFSFFVFSIQAVNAQGDLLNKFADLFINSKDSLNGLEASIHKKIGLAVSLKIQKSDLPLTEERLKTRCELRLRQTGLEVAEIGITRLAVNVGISSNAFVVHLKYKRGVVFDGKETTYRSETATWEKLDVGTHGGDPEYIMSSLDQALDVFVNEYLTANASQNR